MAKLYTVREGNSKGKSLDARRVPEGCVEMNGCVKQYYEIEAREWRNIYSNKELDGYEEHVEEKAK